MGMFFLAVEEGREKINHYYQDCRLRVHTCFYLITEVCMYVFMYGMDYYDRIHCIFEGVLCNIIIFVILLKYKNTQST